MQNRQRRTEATLGRVGLGWSKHRDGRTDGWKTEYVHNMIMFNQGRSRNLKRNLSIAIII